MTLKSIILSNSILSPLEQFEVLNYSIFTNAQYFLLSAVAIMVYI
jgi:hypothetical protein